MERPFDDFARQRTFALQQAKGEWVLFVDADERVPASLAKEIRDAEIEADALAETIREIQAEGKDATPFQGWAGSEGP